MLTHAFFKGGERVRGAGKTLRERIRQENGPRARPGGLIAEKQPWEQNAVPQGCFSFIQYYFRGKGGVCHLLLQVCLLQARNIRHQLRARWPRPAAHPGCGRVHVRHHHSEAPGGSARPHAAVGILHHAQQPGWCVQCRRAFRKISGPAWNASLWSPPMTAESNRARRRSQIVQHAGAVCGGSNGHFAVPARSASSSSSNSLAASGTLCSSLASTLAPYPADMSS